MANAINTTSTISSAVTTAKTLIATANKWRRSIIQALFNAAVVKNIGTVNTVTAEIEDLDTLSADFLTVGTNPTEHAFSSHDIVHFGNELADERDVNKAKLAEVADIIRVARGRVNPYFLKDRTHYTAVVAKATAVLSFLGEELDRREAEEKTRIAAQAEAKRQQAELDRAEHQAFLDAMRDKYRARGPRVPNHAPHANRLVGKGLEALSVIKAEMDKKATDETLVALVLSRKSGKFTSERIMTKAEALSVAQDLSNLPLVFPDGRVLDVVLNKAGKIYRYLLKE